jgi:hypothetical protein
MDRMATSRAGASIFPEYYVQRTAVRSHGWRRAVSFYLGYVVCFELAIIQEADRVK